MRELDDLVGQEIYLLYPGEEEPEHPEEGRGEINTILERTPGRLTLLPLAYISEARFGDGAEISTIGNQFLVNVLGVSYIHEKPLINGTVHYHDLRTDQDEQSPKEISITIQGLIPKNLRNKSTISTRF